MTAILGISAFYHDSAAALVLDGELVAAAQEERFTRIKHDPAFPSRAVAYCLGEAGLTPGQLDYVAFYDKPLTKFERLLETYLTFAPAGFRSFRLAMPLWLKDKLHMRRTIRHALGDSSRARLVFADHHETHAASAFFPSPFERAAIITLDGVGEWSTTTFGVGEGNRIRLTDHIAFPHSLGLLYSAFTYYCGFKVNSGEYKLMGLAPYGRPVYRDVILQRLIDLKDDGSFWLDMDYFQYCQGLTMTGRRFHDLFGGPPRAPESDLEQRHMDLAASIQAVTEEAVFRIARHAAARTGMRNLVLAGGVALNCVANGWLLREGPFDDIWIQPAAGDAGGALGAALFVWHQLLEKPRPITGRDSQKGSFLGPRFDAEGIAAFLADKPSPGRRFDAEEELVEHVAGLLAEGKVVGWFQGRMEFGPRALGARSILGDPRSPAMQATMNLKIKFRESFRPFAPIILRDRAPEWFDIEPGQESPYMLLVAPVREDRRVPVDPEALRVMADDPDLRRRVNVVRSEIPAVTHVDYSARLQTVDEGRNPRLTRLLEAFDRLTGCPVLVNTSFNVRGEPIVCTPEDAYRCFLATDMDVLVLEDTVLTKDEATRRAGAAAREEYLAQFQLD
ncbi:Decarbamoylnovobiocin carbamoyltransferase (plasmid) [Aquisphaera giovannonii]|uniref:Decarbamoylnovobiocin carbamoyltransferase n=1 Tax=Aquisphaera giovannonii TaxID=406548 RepID=A0A5B9WGC1_9BACT|nr:carbamoyltransferase [Aquisphaera giovannonii]QEH39234.1 Decarbamoylnovobiocin carbamoyltransferase [Aquisphaera giovannonii]